MDTLKKLNVNQSLTLVSTNESKEKAKYTENDGVKSGI